MIILIYIILNGRNANWILAVKRISIFFNLDVGFIAKPLVFLQKLMEELKCLKNLKYSKQPLQVDRL